MIEYKENGSFENLKNICIRDNTNLTHGLNILYGGNGDFYFNTFGHEQELSDSKFICKSEFFIQNGGAGWVQFHKLIEDIKTKQYQSHERIIDDEGRISILSDDTSEEKANKLFIEQLDEGIKLTFFQNINDSSFNIGIRVSNSGSRYNPLNLCFMDMYNEFQELARKQDKKIKEEER